MFASPPVSGDYTGASGTVTFKLPLRAGEIPDIRLAVSKEDMGDQRRSLNLQAGFPTELPTETFKLMPRAAGETSGMPSANIKVNVKDDQGNLEGARVAVTSDALTPSQRKAPHERNTGPDGFATVGIELMSADPVEYIRITVSKPGYKEFKDVMEVDNKWGKAVGTTIEIAPISLVKLPDAAFEVRITVLDGQTNRGIPDAEVILDGPDYATKTTDGNGVATLPVDKPGSYKVRISQDYYEKINDVEVRLLPEDKHPDVPAFRLRAKPKKDSAGDTIDVTVMAKDSLDADSKTHPVPKAAVSDGRGTTYTDDDGRASLKGAYEGSQQITVTATDYKPLTKRVGISKFGPFSTGTGTATFVLDPELTEGSPIRLIVEVRDAAEPHNLLNQANVYVQFKDKQLLGEKAPNGEASFTLTGSPEVPLSKLRSGFRVYAKAVNYKLGDSDITTPEWLQPSLETHRATIFLERDWDALLREVQALEAKVEAWKYGKTTDPARIQQFIEKATSELQDAQALFIEFDAVAKTFPELTYFGGQSLCTKVANLQLDIRSCESKVNSKASELEQTIKDASARAPICSSPAAAESLRESYRKAIQLLGEIGKLRNQAIRDHDDLSILPYKASLAQRALAQMKDKAAMLQTLALAAKQNESSATVYINRTDNLKGSSTSVQLSLKAELAVLTVKVEGETGVPANLLQRINNMQGFLSSPTMVSANPLPPIVSSAPIEIARLEESATAKVAEFDRSVCEVITLDEAVEGMKKRVDDASVDVGFANDIPTLADVCVARAAKAARGASTSTGSDTTENKPDDKISTSTGPTKDKKPTAVEEDPEIKIAQPSKPNSQDTSSGGFWESAKAGKKKVENAVNNKPANQTNPATTGETSANKSGTNTAPVDQETPEDSSSTKTAANMPGRRRINPATTDQETPEDNSSTKTAANTPTKRRINPATTDQETPEDSSSTKTAANMPGRRRTNPATTDQETPEDSSSTKTAANMPGRRRTNPATTDQETPEDSSAQYEDCREYARAPKD